MTSRIAGGGVLLAALVAGLAFGPVFTLTALLLPIAATLAPVAGVDLLVLRLPKLVPVRAPLALALGAGAGFVVLALPDAPWSAAARPILDGALHGWLHTLESTFPARTDAALLAFVPLLALLAGVIGLEWLRRGFAPLVTLLPSLAVVGLAQVFRAASGLPAVALAAAFAAAAGIVLAAGHGSVRRSGRRLVDAVALVVPVALVAGLGAWGLAAADPLHVPAYTVHDRFELAAVPAGAVSPLAEIGGRLDQPGKVVFTARTDAPVDRWPQLVLDGFDGAGWTSAAAYRPLGSQLDPDPAVTVPGRTYRADITLGAAADGPWLPTQFRTLSVDGLRPAVDPATGVLLAADRGGVDTYSLRWRAPQPARDQLVGAQVDLAAPGSVRIDEVPAGIVTLTQTALGNAPPTFAQALKLEGWFKAEGYRLAGGDDLPTGSGRAQILAFLDSKGTRRGTSEQFAAAYVLMARTAGIPARLVVGFRQPKQQADGAYVVRNADAFAWPEVAVTGVGWVPLDPTRELHEDPENTPPTTQATDAARQQAQQGVLPVPQQAGAPESPAQLSSAGGPGDAAAIVAAALLGLVLAWVVGVPAARRVRRLRRSRAAGARGVVGAWIDTRDRLRDHGVATRPGMTVRDAAAPARSVLGGGSGELERLARCVDTALWSGHQDVPRAVNDEAWSAASSIRRALAQRPLPERVRAAVGVGRLRARSVRD